MDGVGGTVAGAPEQGAAADVPPAAAEEGAMPVQGAASEAPLGLAAEPSAAADDEVEAAAEQEEDSEDGEEPGAGDAPAQPAQAAAAQAALALPVYYPPVDMSISMTFCNSADFSVKVYWMRPTNGQLVGPGTLVLPTTTATVKTYKDHLWYVFLARPEDFQYHEFDGGLTATSLSTQVHLIKHNEEVMIDAERAGLRQELLLQKHLDAHSDKMKAVGLREETKPPPPPLPELQEKLRVIRVYHAFGARQECDVLTGAYSDRDNPANITDASQIIWPNDKYTDQLKRLDFDQLRQMGKLLNIGNYEYTAHMCSTAGKLNLVQMLTSKLDQLRGLSMPKLRAAAMNAGVDADDLALGVEFERTLSANSKLLKQSSKFEVDEHNDVPADPEDREEIIEKIMRALKDGTQIYAPHPKIQAILFAQYGPVMLPDEAESVPSAIAGVSVDAGSSSTALGAAVPANTDQTRQPHQSRGPSGEFFLAQLGPDMIRAVCTHLALTIQGGPALKRLQATCRGMRDALAADEPEIHELW